MAFPGTGQDNLAMQGDVVEVVGDARSPVGPVMFETGDGQRYHITMTVTESSASEDFVHGYTRITHSYTSATNGARPWSAALKGCCRQGSGTTFELTTKLDLSIPAGAGSPAHKALPMVTVGKHPDMPSAVVAVPVSTPGGERARYWRLGQGSELGSLVRRDPSEVFFNTTDYLDGKLTVNTSALEPGVFSLVVQASLGAAIVPLDFKVAVLSPEETLQRPVLRVQGRPPVLPGGPMLVLQGYVGYELVFTLQASTLAPERTIAATGIRSFSLPEGGMVSSSWASGEPGNHTRMVDVRWMPSAAQEGEHDVCFEALDTRLVASEQLCLALRITPQPGTGPAFSSPSPGAARTFYIRERQQVVLEAQSPNPYDVLAITPARPLLHGQTLSVTQRVEGRRKATDSGEMARVAAVFEWWADTDMGGYNQTLCFTLSTPLAAGTAVVPSGGVVMVGEEGAAVVGELCVAVSVPRCVYRAKEGDDVRRIGEMFELDWLTIWGLNVDLSIMTPPVGSQVMVGRMYTVQEGDSLVSIAKEFEAPVSLLRKLNFDLADGRASSSLPPFTALCLFPNTCSY